MRLVSVDQEKCIRCGACIEECPTHVLELEEDGPKDVQPAVCRVCGHCVAVCPTQAIDHIRTPRAKQIDITEYTRLSPQEAALFLRSRRSVRSYKKNPVPREKIIELVDIAHFAPTGSNRQSISYVIVDDLETLKKASAATIQWLEKNPPLREYFAPMIKAYRHKGVDSILRGAPSLVIATAPKGLEKGRENTMICLTYLELFAPTLGLGTCWAGIFERCAFAGDSPLPEMFKIPQDKKITGAVMVGYPKNRFVRLVDRNPLEVTIFTP
ncbi:MAG: nitroreductase family protein [Clostridia bacterium]|jgi:nitroreductase/NAD-dependent dihydropyrimidine dehydrogenase PreA subunit|nr:nitroreductase family protein [Clostridia bacterium]